jgi:hypothetical protein
MLKLLFILTFLLFLSCERLYETYCWDCTTFTFEKDTYEQTLEIDSMKHEVCDYSELDAQKYENSHTTLWYAISVCGDIRKYECICIKRENK